jgi:putative DNA primase/helicase
MSALLAQAQAKVREIVKLQAAKTSKTANDGVILVNGADLKPEPIRWLWFLWLALGKLHILAGAAGQGKTTLLALIAILTGGRRWPDGTRCEQPGNVLAWSGEDDAADTLLPRLLAMGADPKRVFFVKGSRIEGESVPFDPARDMGQLVAAAERIGNVKLLMVDPVVSAVAGDSHKNTEVRRALQPLVDLAAALDCAVIGITHFSKGSAGRDPTERVTGSLAFGAVARVVMVAGKVKGDDGTERRILARAKSNIGPDDGGFEYAIEQVEVEGHTGIFASRIEWGAAVAGTARELLAEPDEGAAQDADDEPENDVDEFLRELLKDGLPAPSKDIKAAAREVGYAWRTVHRAAKRIGVRIRKDGMAGGWFWTLPKMPNGPEGAEHANSAELTPSASSAPLVASSDDAEVFEP